MTELEEVVSMKRHFPPSAQVDPCPQQPPPRLEGQRNCDGSAHARGQQACWVAMEAVVMPGIEPVRVTVVVMRHWYSEGSQGEPQGEPSWQQPALEMSLGSMMQLGGLVMLRGGREGGGRTY